MSNAALQRTASNLTCSLTAILLIYTSSFETLIEESKIISRRLLNVRLMFVTSAIGLLIVAILGLILLYVLVKLGVRFGKYLAINSIVGIIVLIIANFFLAHYGLMVPINLVAILACALAGIPGALLVILLVLLGIPV